MQGQAADVVIVGAGPVGLTLANLLGMYGVRTLVLERNPRLESEPRAVTLDDESLRTMQTTGLLQQVVDNVVLGYGVQYFDWQGKPFAAIQPTREEYGFPKRNAFRQPCLVQALYDGLARFAHVQVAFGHTVTAFTQHADRVELHSEVAGRNQAVHATWVIACDGGRSPVRELCGIVLGGETYSERWLIVDLDHRTDPGRHTRTYCDPRRPAIRLPGPNGTLRYEFMLRPGDKDDDVLDEANFRAWMAHRVPQDRDLPLVRKVIYGFHARVADRWRQGRVLLAGDAAHLTPPFAGQGLNSGIRDATNLAWKLAAVVQGKLPDTLLDTYEQERRPHASALIQMALRIGKVMQPKTLPGAFLAQTALRLACLFPWCRDYILQLRFKPKPRFEHGFFEPSAGLPWSELMPQPSVEYGQKSVRLDDVLGPDFSIVGTDARAIAQARHRLTLDGFTCRTVQIVARSDDFLPQLATPDAVRVRDSSGELLAWMDRLEASAIVVRPDRYVYQTIAAHA